ncbi:MAG: hypothetical protein Ta2B_05310 [Termitinemataceae bacterium]|nr:MAG: hypothetical protein Ta2B_05310 [Termitinemataceae bacterium]
MKRLLLGTLLIFTINIFSVFAQTEKPKVVIVNFSMEIPFNKELEEDVKAMRRIVHAVAAANGEGEIYHNAETDRIVQIQDINLREVYTQEAMQKFSEQNIQYVITGYVDLPNAKKKYRLRLSLLSTATGAFLIDETGLMSANGKDVSIQTKKIAENFFLKINLGDYFAYMEAAKYKVGGKGPAGGIIFYVKPKLTDGWRYMEVSPKEYEFKAPWGYYSDNYYGPDGSGTDSAIGSGYSNTKFLSARILGQFGSGCASVFCEMLTINGYNDWFLPSKDELLTLFNTLARSGLESFAAEPYWSSTQSTDSSAWFQTFNNGRQYYNGIKTDLHFVRAIRQF